MLDRKVDYEPVYRRFPGPRQWGFPTGYANKGERHEDTIVREVREATVTGDLSSLSLDPREILEARLFRPDELPAAMPDLHRELAAL